MKKSIIFSFFIFLIAPLSSFAQDTTIENQKQEIMSYANPITKDIVNTLLSQLDLTLFIRNYQSDSLFTEWYTYETAKYPKLHNYINNLFFQEIKPKVIEDIFYLPAYQNKIHLDFIRAFNIRDKQKIQNLMILVWNCYKLNKDKVNSIPNEPQFLQTYCSTEIWKIDEYILSKLQTRLKKVPISSLPLPKL